MRLTNEEFNVVNKVSEKSKADCWFELANDEYGNDIVLDLEEDKILSLEDGLLMLDSCLTDLDNYNLSDKEILCYKSLIIKMKTLKRLTRNRLMTLIYNTLIILEEQNNCEGELMETNLADEIGLTEEEYRYIMNG